MKTCFVYLERLDENLLNQYSQKYGLKITSALSYYKNTTSLSAHYFKHEEINENLNKNKKQKRKNGDKSIVRNKFKKKKTKLKPLCYSDDDEDYSDDKKNEENFFERTNIISDGNASDSPNTGDDTTFVKKTLQSKNSAESLRREDGCRNASLDLPELLKLEIGRDVKEKIILKNNFEISNCSENCQELLPASTVNCESIDCHKKMASNSDIISFGCNRNKSESFIKTEFLPKEYEEMDYESREESEDDRITVIFEEKLHDDDYKDIIDQEENERVKTVKKRDKKTRKKQTLIKFRKKKLGRIKNSKNGSVEKFSNKETVRRTTSADRVNEDCLKEVCCLVKRLHELYRIISQLQKESPKNGDLAVHFSKVISAQQENFRREIRKSQKKILQVYEKMLVSYCDPKKVTLEISKQTSLCTDDIIKIISCCLLLEGASEAEKNKNEAIEKNEKLEVIESHKKALNSTNKLNLINENALRPTARKTIQYVDNIEPQHPCFSSWGGSHHSEPVSRLTNQYMEEYQPSTGGQNHIFKSFLGPFGNSPKQYDEKSCTRQRCTEKTQMAFDPKTANTAHDFKQRYLHFVPRHLPQIRSSQSPNIRIQSRPVMLIPESVRPKLYNYSVNSFDFPHEGRLSSSGKEVTNFPCLLNHSQEKTSVNHLCQSYLETPNINVSIPLPAVDNTVECISASKYSALPLCNRLPACTCSSKTFSGVSRRQIPTSGKNQCQLESISTDSAVYSNQKFSRQKGLPNERMFLSIDESTKRNYCIEVNSKPDLGNSSSEILQNVLDPTVPQKLTMKNYRLQAGPVLELDSDSQMSERVDKLNPLIKENSNLKKLKNPKIDCKSRVYDCAQNGCKNPGVRICRGCQSVIYCSDTCQLKDWTLKHKEECHQLKKLRG